MQLAATAALSSRYYEVKSVKVATGEPPASSYRAGGV